MEPDTNVERADNENRDANPAAGCLTWVMGAVVVGVLLSFFSVVFSVHFVGYGFFLSGGPSGFVAGFPVTFVEFGGGALDANDPPSSIFEMWTLGGSVSDVSWTLAAINAILWVIFALVVAAFARWVSRLPA